VAGYLLWYWTIFATGAFNTEATISVLHVVLRICHVCDVLPDTPWRREDPQFVVISGKAVIGVIWLDETRPSVYWRWSITAASHPFEINGGAASREEALAQLAAEWRLYRALDGSNENAGLTPKPPGADGHHDLDQ
jgi:hypothetical protein